MKSDEDKKRRKKMKTFVCCVRECEFLIIGGKNERILARRISFSDMNLTKFTLAAEWKSNGESRIEK